MIFSEHIVESEINQRLVELGLRIRAHRISRGWTIKDMADRLFCSINTYRALEAGKPTVNLGMLAKVLWLFDEANCLDLIAPTPNAPYAGRRARMKSRQSVPGKISELERDF